MTLEKLTVISVTCGYQWRGQKGRRARRRGCRKPSANDELVSVTWRGGIEMQ